MQASDPVTDVLGEPYLARTLTLEPDDEGPVVATLVSRAAERPASAEGRPRRAVLHVHGFCDYFFQTAAADFWVQRGYDFYALDLRKYGRSLRPHQTPNYAADLTEYYPELDEALRIVAAVDGHDEVVISAHSTGGLITSLWVEDRRPAIAGMVLNAPWLDFDGPLLRRLASGLLVERIGAFQPRREVPRSVTGLYGRSLHVDHGGEWDYDLRWKPIESFPVYAGWIRAIRTAQTRLHDGLSLKAPVLVVTSDATARPRTWQPAVDSSDTVLDVERIARWAPALSRHLTVVQVPGALHDVTLSRPPVRAAVFDLVGRWLGAFLEAGGEGSAPA